MSDEKEELKNKPLIKLKTAVSDEKEELINRRLIKLKTAMQILGINNYTTLKRALEIENIPVIFFGDSERVDLMDIERAIEQKKQRQTNY